MTAALPTQAKRLVRIKTTLGADALIVNSAHFSESMSAPFRYHLDVFSETHLHLTAKDMVGTPVTIELVRDDNTLRPFHGYISSLQIIGGAREGQQTHYQIAVESWLMFLRHSSDCRIFQNMKVDEVLKQLFANVKLAKHKFTLTQSHVTQPYWVQYNETSLNFFHRLCQREGLSYYFTHKDGEHTLNVVDSADSLPFLDPSALKLQPGTAAHGHLTSWIPSNQFVTGKHVQRSYNYEQPRDTLTANATVPGDIAGVANVTDVEHFNYSEDYDYSNDGQEETARRAHQQAVAAHNLWRAKGDYLHIAPGHHFQVVPVPSSPSFADNGKTFTVMSVAIHADDVSGTCSASFEAIPQGSLVFASGDSCRIHSLQTAVVTGPAGAEIHTDAFNRIKVQFHWDRYGKNDENTTCWLRVMQAVAGPGFGAHFTPRIGQEVVVAFENGNPDRPFVLGSLYHAENNPPYAAQNGTRNGLRTRSTKGGGASNFNELYFEDSKGAEEVYVQAEKDLNAKVKNNETRNIGNNQTHKVGKVVTVEAGEKILLKAGASTIELNADGTIKINGQTLVEVKGGTVTLN
ncbi:MAG: type VI secretion system tip protein VgrG [Gammaproteobacteria bacterium]|nr:type VI secretion system tip protein VgrG [Gammaproteobacteria bacterium]